MVRLSGTLFSIHIFFEGLLRSDYSVAQLGLGLLGLAMAEQRCFSSLHETLVMSVDRSSGI